MSSARSARLDPERLDAGGRELAGKARPGLLGGALLDLESGEAWALNGSHPFPMQSVFKLVLAAAFLAEADAGRLSINETLTLTDKTLSPDWSPIADAWPTVSAYTAEQLLSAALIQSDNTAADLLMRRIGGPGAVTAWLQAKHVEGIRVDRFEREIQTELAGMASFRPAWKGAAAFAAARATVPPARRRLAMANYLRDPRDTATPTGAANFLKMLAAGELISASATVRLLALMRQTGGGDRLGGGLPRGAIFAHKTGTSGTDLGLTPAFNDVGLATLPDGRRYALTAFLGGSTASPQANASILAELGRLMVSSTSRG